MNSKSSTTTAVESQNAGQPAIFVYPNPAKSELNVLLNTLPEGRTTIEFHDVAGRLALTREITSASACIDISPLPQGIYMYRIISGENVLARDKIVKE